MVGPVALVQAEQRPFEGGRHGPSLGSEIGVLGRLPLWQRRVDVVPQAEVDHFLPGGIVVDRDAGHLHDPRLDGVHEREVAHYPGEDEPFVVARPLQVVGRGRQVVDRLDPGLAADVEQAAEPDPGVPVAFQLFLVRLLVGMLEQLVLVAVVRLVVEHHDLALARPEGPQHPGRHHVRRLGEGVGQVGPTAPKELSGVGRHPLDLLGVAGQEGVVVDDLDLRLQEGVPQVARDEVPLAVVALLPFGMEDAEAVADGDAGRDDQEALGEASVGRRHDFVDRLPGDEHGHHDGLAGAGRHLQPDPGQAVVVEPVLRLEAAAVVGGAVAAGDLSQEDGRLGGLPLAEQDRVVALGWLGSPVGEQLPGVGGDAVPVVRPPALHLAADVVDEGVLLAALAGGVKVEGEFLDVAAFPALPCGRDWDEGFAGPAARQDFAGRAVRTDVEVTLRGIVRRVEDRVGEVHRRHARLKRARLPIDPHRNAERRPVSAGRSRGKGLPRSRVPCGNAGSASSTRLGAVAAARHCGRTPRPIEPCSTYGVCA